MDMLRAKANLMTSLSAMGYRFAIEQFNSENFDREMDDLSRNVRSFFRESDKRLSSKVGEVVLEIVTNVGPLAALNISVDPSVFRIDTVFNPSAVQRSMDFIQPYCGLIGLKFSLGQPVVVGWVDADGLSLEKASTIADAFEKACIELIQTSAKLAGGTRGSVTAVIVLLFEESPTPQFLEILSKACKRRRFWKKIVVLPWCILMDREEVIQHSGLPTIRYSLNGRDLSTQLFRSP